MSSITIRFPDGSRDFRYPPKAPEVGDVLYQENAPYRVISVTGDGDGRDIVIVEPVSDGLGVLLQSEEGAIHLVGVE